MEEASTALAETVTSEEAAAASALLFFRGRSLSGFTGSGGSSEVHATGTTSAAGSRTKTRGGGGGGARGESGCGGSGSGGSGSLENLSLVWCSQLSDAALLALARSSSLRRAEVAGCSGMTCEGLEGLRAAGVEVTTQ